MIDENIGMEHHIVGVEKEWDMYCRHCQQQRKTEIDIISITPIPGIEVPTAFRGQGSTNS